MMKSLFVLLLLLFTFAQTNQASAKRRPWPTPTPTPTPTPAPSPTPAPTGAITVLLSTPSSVSAVPGSSFQLTYNFSGGPTASALKVFVHFVDSNGAIAFGDDHYPPTATNSWSGNISYSRSVYVPSTVPGGSYNVLVGLYDTVSGARMALNVGSGVIDAGSYRYQVGSVALSSPVAAPSPTPTPVPPSSAVNLVPSSYRVIQATSYGVKCDGVSDDSAALQNALYALSDSVALQLPAGKCLYSSGLRVQSKTNVAVFGAGKDQTILVATDPLKSAVVVYGSTNVVLQDFQVYAPSTTFRSSTADTDGVYVEHSSFVSVERVKVVNVSGAGILFFVASDSTVADCEIAHSWSDSYHITGGSKNITVQNSITNNGGDDCYASIGYGTNWNYNIQFLNNYCGSNAASGVDFGGTIGGKAYGNTVEKTAVAGIRVNSDGGWGVGRATNIDIQNNTLINVRTNTSVTHSAFMIYTGTDIVDSVNFSNNTIIDPLTSQAIWLLSYGPTISNVTLQNNQIKDSTGIVTSCFSQTGSTSNISVSGNTKNGLLCNN